MSPFTESTQVYWIVAGVINPGNEEAFRAISTRMIESTKTERGALNYEWTLADDSRTFHIYERYTDSAAAQFHRTHVAELLKEFYAIVTVKSVTLYGNPSPELRQAFAARNALLMTSHNGFSAA